MKSKILPLLVSVLLAACNMQAQNETKPKDGKMPAVRSSTEPLKVGDMAPDFVLNDQNGKAVKLSKAKSPVVLVFYRGYW